MSDPLYAARDCERALQLDPLCEEALETRARALLDLDQLQVRSCHPPPPLLSRSACSLRICASRSQVVRQAEPGSRDKDTEAAGMSGLYMYTLERKPHSATQALCRRQKLPPSPGERGRHRCWG